MQIPILIEPVAGSGFRACSGEPLALSAGGTTREEALAKLRQMLQKKLQNGSEIVTLWVGNADQHPLAPYAGIWAQDDGEIGEWQLDVEEYRRKVDEEDALR